jgi:uncharacterized oligopeptide transporter (OPT) family protein
MLIFGIIALITGKFSVTRSKVVYDTPARIVGVIMMLPLPILLMLGVALGFGLLAQGRPLNQEDLDRLKTLGMILGAVVILGCFIIGMVVAFIYAEPPRKKRGRDEEDFEEDDRPRRRRQVEEEDLDEERPRRPPRPPDDRFRE